MSATASYDPTPSIPAPTATQTTNSSSLDVNYPFTDKEIPLPGDAGANVHLKCKNCSTFGKIDFAFASFSRRDFGDTNNETGLQLGDFFTGGEARIVTKGLGAKVELEIGLDNDGGFDVPLFEVPLLYALAVSQQLQLRLLTALANTRVDSRHMQSRAFIHAFAPLSVLTKRFSHVYHRLRDCRP